MVDRNTFVYKMIKKLSEKNIYSIFEISVVLKGIHAIFEIVSGILAFFLTKAFFVSVITFFTRGELLEEPNDFFANYFMTMTNNFSINTKYFLIFYLLSHGIIKLFLVVGLLRKKLWAYPASIAVFSLFVFYQIFRYFHTFSIGLLLLTILDLIIIFLTIHEYRYLKSHDIH
ncbi:MAG: DUF2127 domain-containing protein [Candidatus Nomurabacteria bacterium]|nr:DUF2127 domain-containing protein [Candidatus Nomurabacteria bacterium]